MRTFALYYVVAPLATAQPTVSKNFNGEEI